jgi:hypothetical protein
MPLAPPMIPVFSAGVGYQAPALDVLVQNSLGFQTAGIVFRAVQKTTQAITGSTFTTLTMDTVLEDPYSGWSSGSNEWLAPFTGWYEITTGWSCLAANATIEAVIAISGLQYELEEITVTTAITGGAGASLGPVPLVGGQDFVQAQAWSSAGVSTSTASNGRQPWMEITYVSQ